MPSKAFKLAEAMVSNPVMSDMVENPTATPTQIAAVETKTSAISDTGIISVNTKNIVSNNVLTQSFDSNQVVGFNLTDSINAVSPIVSVFKEVPVTGVTSKGQWDVNANATNYEFFDEKPISYSSATLTPSATGDGTFTSSTAISSTYDISSLSLNNTFDISTVSVTANGGFFKPDGTVLYFHDNQADTILQYPLTTAWDLSTVGSTTGNVAVGSQDTNIRGPAFSADGTKMYTCGYMNDKYFQYTLSTAWDVTSASYSNKSVSFASVDAASSIMHWKSDGSSFFSVGSVNDTVYRWDLTTAWDISTASNVSNFSISSVFNIPYGVSLNPDGAKMYIVGRTVNSDYEVRQYSLSTAFDITTASYDSVLWDYVSDGGQTGAPEHLFFGSSGTRLYLTKSGANITEWVSGSITAFSSADVGKKVVGNSGSAIITSTAGAYTSVTAFADTSAISSWQLFGAEGKADGSGIVFTQAGAPGGIPTSTLTDQSGPHTIHTGFFNQGFWWSNDGQYYYQLSQGNSTIVKVKCTTPWDLSTQTDEQTVSTTGTSHGITVSEDGLNIYYGGYDARIRRKPLSTAHDLSTAGSETSILCTDLNVAASYPWDFDISSDGTKLFFLSHIGGSHDGIGTLNLSTPYAIHTGVTLGTVLTNFDGGGHSQTFFSFNSDGSRLFVSNNTTSIYYWNLSSAYTLPSSATSDGSISFSGSNGQRSMVFDQYLFYTSFHDDRGGALGVEHEKQNRWTLSTSIDASSTTPAYSQYFPALTNSSTGQINSSAWQDINSMTADETKNGGDIFYAVSTDNRTSWSVAKASDGVRKIVKNNSGTWQYNNHAGSTSTYDLANAAYDSKEADVSGTHSSELSGVAFKTDGTKMYVVGNTSDTVNQYGLSTAWDVSTATYDNVSFSVSSQDGYPSDIFFKPDGTKMFVIGVDSDEINTYTLSTAWDLSTASYTSVYAMWAPTNGGVDFPDGVFFKPDGTKMYIATTSPADKVYEFALSTAWDPTSASITYGTDFLDVSSQETSLMTLVISDDGTKLYIVGSANDTIYQYNLSTAWDISSGTYSNISFNLSSQAIYPRGLALKSDGTKIYVANSATDRIYQYSIGGSQYGTSETWVNGTNNNEHATLQQALTSQAFNRMNKAQLDAVADGYHFSQDSADTLDLMIAPYAASGNTPISDGVTINYDAAVLIREAVAGTDYIAEFPNSSTINIKSLVNANIKVRAL